MRPFTGAHPIVLLLAAAATVLLLTAAARIAAGRDIGTGVLPARESAEPRLGLLSSPLAQALRSERGSLIVGSQASARFAYITGVIAKSTSPRESPRACNARSQSSAPARSSTPTGYLAFVFIFFVLAVSLFVCAQIGAARHEEADERLETLLALPVSRRRWLGGRLVLAVRAPPRSP